jgi:hypothetical protein
VATGRSRDQIVQLLRDWGAVGVQWTDEWESNQVILRFKWVNGEAGYMARFNLHLPTREELEERDDMIDQRTGRPSESRVAKAMARRGEQEHRVLLLLLKAAFNAVEIGLLDAEQIFLPFFEGRDGSTVWEAAKENLPALGTGSAVKLLPAGR